MTTEYNINNLVKGVNGFGLPFCDTIYSTTLAASTDTSVTVPGTISTGLMSSSSYNRFIAVFSYTLGDDVFVALNAAAAVPVGDTFAATTSELNPTAKKVKAGDVIHFISADTASITVAFYSVMEG